MCPVTHCFVHPLPAYGHAEYHCDGRRQIGRYGLDVDEHLTVLELLDQRNPEDADHNEGEDTDPGNDRCLISNYVKQENG